MQFKNHTPFPGVAWKNIDYKNKAYISCVVRVKYAFDEVNQDGHWSLKLDSDQGELFGKDIFYDEEDLLNSSVRFESDYVSYKPYGDLVINGYAHSTVPLREWRCGLKVLRETDIEDTILLEKWLRIRGERYIQNDVIGYSFTTSKKSIKVPLRYEYANGGAVVNPNYNIENKEDTKPYLLYAQYNPVGVGIAHKSMFDRDVLHRAPQIESMAESLDKPNMSNPPQGFGFIGRSWKPRINLAGTFDEKWKKEKHPLMPDNFQESHNNAAHQDLQLKGYFLPHDKILLYNLVKDRHVESFSLPNFYFKAKVKEVFDSHPYFLNIDTVIIDLMEDKMKKNAVYVSYRIRIPTSNQVKEVSVNMHVPKDFIGESDG